VDADIIVRLLAGDDPVKQQRAASLFEQVEAGQLQVTTPVTTIADCVYVLCSPRLYHFPRAEVVARLLTLVRLPYFRIRNRRTVIRALDLFASTALDFGDALIAATMAETDSADVYSYDKDFDGLPGITRREP